MSLNEAETRAEYIDPALKAAGWGVVEDSRILREYRITQGRLQGGGRRTEPEIADYVLVYRNLKLAVVEAKRRDAHYTEGVAQAKSYAKKLSIRYTYATNGLEIYGIDMQTGVEGDAPAYPSPDELWAKTFAVQNAWRDRFAAIPFEDKSGTWQSRYYQDIAIDRVLEAIADKRSRILLTLATGTGKTFIAFQLAWKLFQSRWNLTDWKPTPSPRGGRVSSSWPTGTSWPTKPTTPSPRSPKTPWYASTRRPSRRRAEFPPMAASSSPSSRPSCAARETAHTSATTRQISSTSSS